MSISPKLMMAAAENAGGGFAIGESLRFNDNDNAYLTRTPASAGDRKTWTWSGWVKRGNLGSRQTLWSARNGTSGHTIELSSDAISIFKTGAGSVMTLLTDAVFRDVSAWYHIVFEVDTTQSTASDRFKIYINGKLISSFSSASYPALNADLEWNNTKEHDLGRRSDNVFYFDGYLSDVYFIDGQALDPSRFGKEDADGVWQPISYTGTYGTNGFHLDFADNSTAAALGTDVSGNGNDWTPSGITTDDQVTDTPSVNYATLNPLSKAIIVGQGASPTFSDGNLNVNGDNQSSAGTFGVSSGKWYYEVTQQDSGNLTNGVGWYREGTSEESIYRDSGNFRFDGSEAAYGASWQSSGDIIGIALDLDNTAISFYKNGVSQGNAKTNLPAGTYIPFIYCRVPSNLTANFGQLGFAYTPPTGFQALNSANLPAPVIADGKEHFQPALYTGNGTTQTISGLEFQPDFVWIKVRTAVNSHYVFDTIRGADQALFTDSTSTEIDYSATGRMTSFDSDGFAVEHGASTGTNALGESYVAWNWNAGGSTVTNTDGTITSQVRANTDAGFSIVSYTGNGIAGATVGHGLGANADVVIVKARGFASNWVNWHRALGDNTRLHLNTTDAVQSNTVFVRSATSTTFTMGAAGNNNSNGEDYVAYCFSSVDGFSKFGSYTGNGSADGPFIYTGFLPAFVIVKKTNTTSSWAMMDNKRTANYNDVDARLFADLPDTEYVAEVCDFLSNGFKLRSTFSTTNRSGDSYIFMAFAENPFKTARAR